MDPNEGSEVLEESEDLSTEETAPEGVEEADEAPAPEARRYKVKVDGQEVEVDEATLLKDYQLAKASHARMQQAAQLRADAESQIAQVRALAEQTKQDPRSLFKALGLDARAFAEALLTEEIENELLTDDEKDYRRLKAWEKKHQEEISQRQKKEQLEKAEALTQQAGDEVESEIVDAFRSRGIQPTPDLVASVAELMEASLNGEGPCMKASVAIERLAPEQRRRAVNWLDTQDPETLEREYPSLYKKILQHAANKSSSVPAFERGIGQKKQASAPRAKTWEELMKD